MAKPTFELVVAGGRIVTPHGIRCCDLAINGGRIAALGAALAEHADEVIDASHMLVLPGVVDAHVHPVYVDGLQACSRAAAFGGTTTLIHFAFAHPGERAVDSVCAMRDEGLAGAYTDFALHVALFDPARQMHEIDALVALGITSFKFFMTYARLGWMVQDGDLLESMLRIKTAGGLAMVHAESGLAIDRLEDLLASLTDPREFLARTHPPELETEAVERALKFAALTGCPLFVVHLSAAASVEPLARARQRGQRVYVETCPHYLTLTDARICEFGARAKIGPPLRDERHQAALWQAIRAGVIDTIGSDHVPKPKRTDEDIRQAGFGAPGIETLLPVIYDAGVNTGLISVCDLARLTAEMPARIFGLYPRKGALIPGADADLVIFDPARPTTINHADQQTGVGFSLYAGRTCLGWPTLTMQRGHILMREGQFYGEPGRGQFLVRQP